MSNKKKCKKGDLKCTFGIDRLNQNITNTYQSDYVCQPNQHGWSVVTDPKLIPESKYIKKCQNTPEYETDSGTFKKDNTHGFMLPMIKKSSFMDDYLTWPEPPRRNKCIICPNSGIKEPKIEIPNSGINSQSPIKSIKSILSNPFKKSKNNKTTSKTTSKTKTETGKNSKNTKKNNEKDEKDKKCKQHRDCKTKMCRKKYKDDKFGKCDNHLKRSESLLGEPCLGNRHCKNSRILKSKKGQNFCRYDKMSSTLRGRMMEKLDHFSRSGVSNWRGKQPLSHGICSKSLKNGYKKDEERQKKGFDLGRECNNDSQCKTNFCKHIKYNDKYGICTKKLRETDRKIGQYCEYNGNCKSHYCKQENINDTYGYCSNTHTRKFFIDQLCRKNRDCMSNYCHKDTDKDNPEGNKFGVCKDEIGNKKCKNDNECISFNCSRKKKICTELEKKTCYDESYCNPKFKKDDKYQLKWSSWLGVPTPGSNYSKAYKQWAKEFTGVKEEEPKITEYYKCSKKDGEDAGKCVLDEEIKKMYDYRKNAYKLSIDLEKHNINMYRSKKKEDQSIYVSEDNSDNMGGDGEGDDTEDGKEEKESGKEVEIKPSEIARNDDEKDIFFNEKMIKMRKDCKKKYCNSFAGAVFAHDPCVGSSKYYKCVADIKNKRCEELHGETHIPWKSNSNKIRYCKNTSIFEPPERFEEMGISL